MLRARDQVTWLDRLTAEHDNCAAALRHAIDAGDVRTALRFVRALAWFWLLRDYDAEASEWAATAAALVGDTPPEGLRGRLRDLRAGLDDQPGPAGVPRTDPGADHRARSVPLAGGSTHPMLVLARAIVTCSPATWTPPG